MKEILDLQLGSLTQIGSEVHETRIEKVIKSKKNYINEKNVAILKSRRLLFSYVSGPYWTLSCACTKPLTFLQNSKCLKQLFHFLMSQKTILINLGYNDEVFFLNKFTLITNKNCSIFGFTLQFFCWSPTIRDNQSLLYIDNKDKKSSWKTIKFFRYLHKIRKQKKIFEYQHNLKCLHKYLNLSLDFVSWPTILNTQKNGNQGSISPKFYERRSPKRKKYSQAVSLFCAFGICNCKSCTQNVDEIEPRSVKIQCLPLNWINLGQIKSDNINRLIQFTDEFLRLKQKILLTKSKFHIVYLQRCLRLSFFK